MTGASTPASRERAAEQRHEIERLDGLADALGDLGRRHALREQLAGAPVARAGASTVATRSPAPARPIIDSGRAPRASAKRQTSAKMWPAAAPAALSPCASVAPDASAAAFFAAPASSTPSGSFDSSQTTPARMNVRAISRASSSFSEAATSPAPSLTISRACAGPPTTATRCAP